MTGKAQKKLLFYVDPAWRNLPGAYSIFMYPFWGNQSSDSSPFKKLATETYPFDTSCYGVTDHIENADAVCMPFSYDVALRYSPKLLEECIALSQKSGLHLVLDGIGHSDAPFKMQNTSVIRYGGYRFEKDPCEIYVTPFADDLLERYKGGTLSVRQKQPRASISFVGWGQLTPSLRAKAMIKELPERLRGVFDSRYRAKKKGLFFREKAIRALVSSALLDSRILSRPSYSGSIKTARGDINVMRNEFVDTVWACDYGLEVRGNSNTSTRLSEILSLGRIPVIIDTQRNLAFSDEINYRDFSVVVDFRDVHKLPNIVSEFHATVSDADFSAMQRKAREVYMSYFRPDKVMPHIINSIRKNMR